MSALDVVASGTDLPRGAVLVAAIVTGLCLGSFLNVVIARLPRGESLIDPPSRCPSCWKPVRPRDNVPLLGWLLLRGRCRDCGAPISPRYPLVEMLGGILAVVAAAVMPTPAAAAASLTLLLALTAVFFIDLDHQLILDAVTLPGIVTGLVLCPLVGTSRIDAAIGAAGGWLFFRAIREGYRHWRGREGLGGGDVKLAAMLGAWLGWQGVLMTILLGSLFGSIVGVSLAAKGRAGRETPLPYGAFLAPAAIAVTLWGAAAWRWYLSL